MPKKLNITVIGAGHGGKAMAAHLALMDFPVILYNRTPENVAAIKELGGIYLESFDGGPRGFGKLKLVTSSLAEALENAQMVMIVVPSSAHADIAKACAPYLADGQIIILHPGRTCGAIEFTRVIRNSGCTADVTVAEAETFIYASRSDGPAQARIFRIKEAVPLAALPSDRNQLVLDHMREVFPQFIDGENVLQTGLNNMGAIFHPALTILNSGWIESTHGDFQFYIDGVTPSVGRVLESLDRERVTVAASIGIRARTGMEWLKLSYDTVGEDLNEAIHNQPGSYRLSRSAVRGCGQWD
jgi:opine dehydrogenase